MKKIVRSPEGCFDVDGVWLNVERNVDLSYTGSVFILVHLMAFCNILRLTNVVALYLVAFIFAINSSEGEIRNLPFCDPDKLTTQHK
jgi:hypothetical protein